MLRHPRIHLLEPLGYLDFVQLMRRARLILTDSGGLQEEAPSLGVPVLVLREATERPEVVRCGVARLLGRNPKRIVREAEFLLKSKRAYRRMSRAGNPYGDGKAARRIVEGVRYFFGLRREKPVDFRGC